MFFIAFLLLFIYPKQNISCIIYILFLHSPVSQSFHLLILYVKNTSEVATDLKKKKFFYSFAINKIAHVQLNMRLGTQDYSLLRKAKQDQGRRLRSGQQSPMLRNCWLGAWHSFDPCQAAHFSLTRSGHSSGVGVDRGSLPMSSRGCSYSSGGWRKLSRMGLSHARPCQLASRPKKTPVYLLLCI